VREQSIGKIKGKMKKERERKVKNKSKGDELIRLVLVEKKFSCPEGKLLKQRRKEIDARYKSRSVREKWKNPYRYIESAETARGKTQKRLNSGSTNLSHSLHFPSFYFSSSPFLLCFHWGVSPLVR
jgi:hypothetical protein